MTYGDFGGSYNPNNAGFGGRSFPQNICRSGVMEGCPLEYSSAALECLPPCGDCPPLQPRRPKWVKIQQPPRTICKKRYVNVKQRIYEPHLVPIQKTIDVPHVNYTYRRTRIPKVSYRVQVVNEPALIYEPKEWTGPILITKPRITCEPQEICSTFICKPKPQYIYVPPPEKYCCDPQGTVFTRPTGPCPPCLSPYPICCRGTFLSNANGHQNVSYF